MPYCFGSDASDDVRWQRFLQTPLLSQRERSAWLLSGFSPPHGSQQPPPALAPIDEGRWAALQASLVEDLPIPWQFGQYQQPVCLVHRGEAAYPLRLAECADAPPALFCVGDNRLLSHPGIAVVGSRRPSRDGARAEAQGRADDRARRRLLARDGRRVRRGRAPALLASEAAAARRARGEGGGGARRRRA